MSKTSDHTEWEPHKAQIEQIYLHEGKTQRELSRIMEKTYGFRKTKPQYEKAFERWNFKKYQMTSERWKFVKHRKEKRKRENGKQSEVYIDGILCPSKRVKYEIGRQAFESTIAKFTSGRPHLTLNAKAVQLMFPGVFSKNTRRCDCLFSWADYIAITMASKSPLVWFLSNGFIAKFLKEPSVSKQFHVTSSSTHWTFAITVEKEPDPLTGLFAVLENHQISQSTPEQLSSDSSTECYHARRIL
ncbi:hypothetical protein N7501_008080 [Penicillium viridicatum]|nr:hypothetical protein N7501_008080 [Penicillium viridicatum]